MLTEYIKSPSRIQELRDGPDGSLFEAFAQELHQAGYAKITARRHLRAAEHLVHWTRLKGAPITTLDERFVEEFAHRLDRSRCPRYARTQRNGVRLFIGHLRRAGILTSPINKESIEDPVLLISFRRWMQQQRGTCDATLYNYCLDIRDLLKSLGEDPTKFDAKRLRKFVLEKSQQCGWGGAKRCITAVRMFLRFLIADGKCAVGLDASIPALAHWRSFVLAAVFAAR